MKQIYQARKRRQLRYLVKRLKFILKDTQDGAQNKIDTLILKIKARVKKLSRILAPFHLKKIIGAVAMILGMSFTSPVAAQSFAAPQENPFGIEPLAQFTTFASFADLDGDGDLDLLLGEYVVSSTGVINYLENTGTASIPQFAAPQENPFGLTVELEMIMYPVLADLDGDGDFDILLPAVSPPPSNAVSFKYFENTGNATTPSFATAVDNPFGLAPNGQFVLYPSFVDLDQDGDVDLLVVDGDGDVQYFENTGSATNPAFAAAVINPYGLGTTDDYVLPTFADLDVDGDLDMLAGENMNFLYFENAGASGNPQFGASVENPFDLIPSVYFISPTFVDLDEDGDMDLFVSQDNANFQYFENTTPVAVDEQYVNIPLDLYPNPINDILSIVSETPFEKIEVYDAMGKLIRIYNGTVNTINVSDWSSGMYLLKFIDGEGRFTSRKVVKE